MTMEPHDKSPIITVWFYKNQQYSACVSSKKEGFQAPPQQGPLKVLLPGWLGKNTFPNSTRLLAFKTSVRMMHSSCANVHGVQVSSNTCSHSDITGYLLDTFV